MQRRFTLIEMLVTLIVLVMLATVAIRGTSGFVDQARYERSAGTLKALEASILDDEGFVNDMGRLPNAVSVSGTLTLQELYDSTSQPGFSFRTHADDSDVRLACGWRGPYLRLPLGEESLVDGWGNDFELRVQSGDLAGDGDSVAQIVSLGSDRASGGTEAYDSDVELFVANSSEQRHESKVLVSVSTSSGTYSPSAGETVTVRAYYPDPDNNGLIYVEDSIDATSLGTDYASLNDIPRGTRILRAYYPSVSDAVAGSSGAHISLVRHVLLDQSSESFLLELVEP